jgi:hypothetical protein
MEMTETRPDACSREIVQPLVLFKQTDDDDDDANGQSNDNIDNS